MDGGTPWTSGTSRASTARVRGSIPARTVPSGAMNPLRPLTEAITTVRPVSRARSRLIANCCSIWPVWMKNAFEVCTVSSSAPPRTCSLIASS